MNELKTIVGFTLGFALMFFLIALAIAYPLMLMWNYVIPNITNGAIKEITFWQMFWLNILVSSMFKNTSYQSKK